MDHLLEQFQRADEVAAASGCTVEELDWLRRRRLILAVVEDGTLYVYKGDAKWLAALRREHPEVVSEVMAGEWVPMAIVAQRLDLTFRQVYRMVEAGDLPVRRLGNHVVLRRSHFERLRAL